MRLRRVGLDQQRPTFVDLELQVQVVAGIQQAGGSDRDVHAAGAPNGEIEAQIVDPALPTEGGEHLHLALGVVDVEGDRQPARSLALGRQGRTADQPQGLHLDPVGVEAADQQLRIAPLQVQVPGLQPDALFVADRQTADAQVAPDVAGQALDLQPPQATDLQPVGARLDQQPRLGQQHAIARAGEQACEDQHHRQADCDDRLGEAGGLLRRLFGGGRGLGFLAQKLCPMLT
jgi:hypothetical protein